MLKLTKRPVIQGMLLIGFFLWGGAAVLGIIGAYSWATLPTLVTTVCGIAVGCFFIASELDW